MVKKVIFGNSDLKSNFLVVSPENFKIGIYNFEYVDYVLNFKRKLEKSDFQGISFLENFMFDDISAWWLIHERFFYAIQPQINFIILFENFLQKHKPEIIEIKNHFEYFKLIQQICKKHKILLQYDKIYLQKFAIRQKLKKTFTNIIRKYRLSKSTKFLISNHKSQFVKKYDDLPSIKNKIIFATPVTYRRSIFNPKTTQFEYGEYLTKPLMEFLDRIHEDYLGISIPFMTDLSFSNIYEKRLTDQMKWIPEEYFLNNKFDSINQFLKKYSNLINNKKFHNLFSFNEINFWDSISGMFLQMTFLPYLPYWLSLYLGYCDVFESEKPKSIFIPSETDPSSIITISACNKFTIPTIGLQHGWFSLTGPPGYLQNSELNSHKFSYPFPSKMFVWGNVSKKLLITMGWPKNQITVFGNTYYHYLKFINKLVEDPPFSKFNIDPSKKIILFTTTNMQSKYSFPGYVYDTKVWKYLLENFSNDNDFIIILKPHPHEDVSEFEKILNELKSTNSVILQGNLQELLSISDIVISNYSTVILDALAMKKPIIELNWPDIDENTSQYSSLMEHVEIKDLKNKIYELVRNYNFNEEDWSKIMNELFNIPLDENEIKNILMKLD